jgi:hypothetical protein
MCLVSSEVKFCSCEVDDYNELPHYWVLHRFHRDKDIQVLGSIVMREDFLNPHYNLNEKTFTTRLNTSDAFDKEIAFKENDRLEIVLNNKEGGDLMTFCFRYKKKKWVVIPYDTFKLMSRFDELDFGKFSQLEK